MVVIGHTLYNCLKLSLGFYAQWEGAAKTVADHWGQRWNTPDKYPASYKDSL